MISSSILFVLVQCIISFLFGVISGILSKVGTSEQCNKTDSILDLNLTKFLIYVCVINLIFSALSMIYCICKVKSFQIIRNLIYSHWFWSFIWFVFGSVILFRGNLYCIQTSSISAVSALVIWCTMMIHPTCFWLVNKRLYQNQVEEN